MPRRFAPFLLFLPALLLFWNLGYAAFWNPDEGRYASASYEMAYPLQGETSDWLVPHLNTLTRLNKPPLIYWLAASSFRVFGLSEAAGRLPSALAAFGVAVVLFCWGRVAFGEREGLAAALVWCTTAFPFAMGRVLNTDMLLTFTIALASFGIWLAFRAKEEPERGGFGLAVAVAGIGMGLALLAKGPVGVAIPLVTAFLFLTATRGWSRAPWKAVPLALTIALVIGAPWYVLVQRQVPDFFDLFFRKENLSRLTGQGNFHSGTSYIYYLPVLLLGLLPWTGYLFTTLGSWVLNEKEKKARLFLWCYAGFIIIFFSISKTKLVSYVLPAFPALALLIGAGVARWETQAAWRRTASLISAIVIFIATGAISSVYMLNDKLFPKAEGKVVMTQIGIVLLIGVLAHVYLLLKGTALRVLAVEGCAMALLLGTLLNMGHRLSPREEIAGLFLLVRSEIQPGDTIIGYGGFQPNMVYYTQRPVYYLGFKNTSGFRDEDVKASPYFPDYRTAAEMENPALSKAPSPDPKKFVEILKRARRAFVISSSSVDQKVMARKDLYFWGSNNDAYFYATWPKPAGAELNLTAPRSRLIRRRTAD